MKLVINDPKTGKSYQKDIGEAGVRLYGKKIGDEIDGNEFGLPGYTLKITGGTDTSGFPMVPWLKTQQKKKILMEAGPGFRPTRRGERRRKTVRGAVISAEIAQVNAVVIKAGNQSLDELLGGKKEDATGS